MNSPVHSSLPPGGETLNTPGGFNGIVIARPAIVIPEYKDRSGSDPSPQETQPNPGRDSEFPVKKVKGNGNENSNRNSMDKRLKGTDEAFITTSPREKFSVTDNLTGVIAQPRKLPIPNTAANTNSAIKGILLKPKRILPAQPGSFVVKSPIQNAVENSTIPSVEPVEESVHTNTGGLNPGRVNGTALSDSPPRLSVTKLQINVDRLKSYFATPAKGGSNVNSSLGQSANSPLCKENDIKPNANITGQVRLRAQCDKNVDSNGGFKHDDNTDKQNGDLIKLEENDIRNDGLKQNQEIKIRSVGLKTTGEEFSTITNWCSKEINKMTNNISTGPPMSKTSDRNIRSPSPKSNTTWDRSSSGYSSDERADPRSPPPTISSASTECTKVDTVLDDDGVSMLHDVSDKQRTNCDITNNLVPGVTDTQGDGGVKCEKSDANCESDVKCDCPIPDVCPHSLGQTKVSSDKCETCDTNESNTVTPELGRQASCLPIESQIIPKTVNRRPTWNGGMLNPTASGRIQYRKSGTDPTINLRHPIRQNNVDSNFGGLEVCGKSYPQSINFTGKNEQQPVSSETPRNEATSGGARAEMLTPRSAFSLPDRSAGSVTENSNGGGGEVIRPKVIRQPLSTAKSLKDIKTMTLNMNVKLNLSRDDKDIRKTLQDLNSPRRQSPGGKSLPIRARHDPTISQSMNSSFTAIQKPANGGLGKKMWRAPSGLPEHAQMRPFSPFGGTLPPSKLKDNKKHMME